MVDAIRAMGARTPDEDPSLQNKEKDGKQELKSANPFNGIVQSIYLENQAEIDKNLQDSNPENDSYYVPYDQNDLGIKGLSIQFTTTDGVEGANATYTFDMAKTTQSEMATTPEGGIVKAGQNKHITPEMFKKYQDLSVKIMDPRRDVRKKAEKELEQLLDDMYRPLKQTIKGETKALYTEKQLKELKKAIISDMKAEYEAENTELFLPARGQWTNKDYVDAKKKLKEEQAEAQKRFDEAVNAGKEPDPNDIKILNKKVKTLTAGAEQFVLQNKDLFFDEEGKFSSDKYKEFASQLCGQDNTLTVAERTSGRNRSKMRSNKEEREAQKRLNEANEADLIANATRAQARIDAKERIKQIDEIKTKQAAGTELTDEEKALLPPQETDYQAAKARLEAEARIKNIDAIKAKGANATEAEKALLPPTVREYGLALTRIEAGNALAGDEALVQRYEQYVADSQHRAQAGDEELVQKYEKYSADKDLANEVTDADNEAVQKYEQYKQDLEIDRHSQREGFLGMRSAHGSLQREIVKNAGYDGKFDYRPLIALATTALSVAASTVGAAAATKLIQHSLDTDLDVWARATANAVADAAAEASVDGGVAAARAAARAAAEAAANAGVQGTITSTVCNQFVATLASGGIGYLAGIAEGAAITIPVHAKPETPRPDVAEGKEQTKPDRIEGETVVQGCPTQGVDPGPSPDPSVEPDNNNNNNNKDCDDCDAGTYTINIPKTGKVTTDENGNKWTTGILFYQIAELYDGYKDLSASDKKAFRAALKEALAKYNSDGENKKFDYLKSGTSTLCLTFEFKGKTYTLDQSKAENLKPVRYKLKGKSVGANIKSPCPPKSE